MGYVNTHYLEEKVESIFSPVAWGSSMALGFFMAQLGVFFLIK